MKKITYFFKIVFEIKKDAFCKSKSIFYCYFLFLDQLSRYPKVNSAQEYALIY